MKYLNFICINDAFCERVDAMQIEPVEIGTSNERFIEPIRRGLVATARRDTGYTMTGTIQGKDATLVLRDEGVPVALICVCLHSRASQNLWDSMYDTSVCPLPDLIGPPSAPWVAVRYDVQEQIIPPWLDHTAKAIAWALATE